MDSEKKLLLLHLKSDLREVLKLAREKSNELVKALHYNESNIKSKTEDLEYYISSLLDLTKEIKNLFNNTDGILRTKELISNKEVAEFEKLLGNITLTRSGDMESLLKLLRTLEDKEYYELCARVNARIKMFPGKAV